MWEAPSVVASRRNRYCMRDLLPITKQIYTHGGECLRQGGRRVRSRGGPTDRLSEIPTLRPNELPDQGAFIGYQACETSHNPPCGLRPVRSASPDATVHSPFEVCD